MDKAMRWVIPEGGELLWAWGLAYLPDPKGKLCWSCGLRSGPTYPVVCKRMQEEDISFF